MSSSTSTRFDKAIVTGANGLVGRVVVRYLLSHGVEVLCLGRQSLSTQAVVKRFGAGATYLTLFMENISALPGKAESIGWFAGERCVFFHFAWSGSARLTDGGFEKQLKNASYAVNALTCAKEIGCVKFVNAGTYEETRVDLSLMENSDASVSPMQVDYALAKLAARDMCQMVAYLEKIDYVHTRLSVPLDPELSSGGYVANTLRNILLGQPYQPPENSELLDIVSVHDVAHAYYLIGGSGRNKADYFIGTGEPATLSVYFDRFIKLLEVGQPAVLNPSIRSVGFDVSKLRDDTGFVARNRFTDMFHELLSS